MVNWDNGLVILVVMVVFSWLIGESGLDFLQKFGFKFDKSIKRATICFVFSTILNLTILALILYSLLFQWPQ